MMLQYYLAFLQNILPPILHARMLSQSFSPLVCQGLSFIIRSIHDIGQALPKCPYPGDSVLTFLGVVGKC